MRSIYISILAALVSISAFSQITFDTTYANQWNSKTNSWDNFNRTIISYNNDLISSEIIQIFNNNKWMNYNFKAYYYNNNQIIEEFEQFWNDSQLKWEDNYRKLYSYDENGLLVKLTHQNIFKGNYINTSREIMKYTPEGKLKEKIVEKFDEAWTNFLKYQYYYNADYLLMEENLTYWDISSWDDNSFNVIYKYDGYGYITEKIKVKKSDSKDKKIAREDFYYGGNGRLEEHIVSTWNSRKDKWEYSNRALYVNNLSGYVISLLNQESKTKEWENYLFTKFSGKKEFINGVSIEDNMTFTIYTSNFGTKATIEFSNPYKELFNVNVINEDGFLIASASTTKDEVSIDARDMNRGQYFVELQGRNLYSGKFSIE